MFPTVGLPKPRSNAKWHPVFAAALSCKPNTQATHSLFHFFITSASWWEGSSSYYIECFNLLMCSLKIAIVHNLFQNQMLMKCTICFISQRFAGVQRKSIIALLGILHCFKRLSAPLISHPWKKDMMLAIPGWGSLLSREDCVKVS